MAGGRELDAGLYAGRGEPIVDKLSKRDQFSRPSSDPRRSSAKRNELLFGEPLWRDRVAQRSEMVPRWRDSDKTLFEHRHLRQRHCRVALAVESKVGGALCYGSIDL